MLGFSSTKSNGQIARVDVGPKVPAVKMDIDKGNKKKSEGMNISKNAIREQTLDKVKRMAKEMRTGNTGCEED